MPNQPIADLIADRLGSLTTTDAQGNEIVIPIAGYRTTGMTPEQAEPIIAGAKLVGEAIVHTIETAGASTILPTAELTQLRDRADATAPTGPQVVRFTCTLCHNPLFGLSIDLADPTVNGPHLIEQLGKLTPACPHTPQATA